MTNSSAVHLFWRDRSICDRFRNAVSLHSHTSHSKETLAFLPSVLKDVPIARSTLRNIEDHHRVVKGEDLDFSRAYWTPPLTAPQALDLERDQVTRLSLAPLVSITDHDNLDACDQLRLMDEEIPHSVEWTVPFDAATFHIGVHNLPSSQAHSILADLEEYTSNPNQKRLADLLNGLHCIQDVLIVLNHPLSDEGRVGNPIHEEHLHRFLNRYGEWMHALELNALQPWLANLRVGEIARALDYPLISGGDRHGCEPNGNLNLTNAATFAEFVQEIRNDRISEVVLMPQCREPLAVRYLECIWHIVREYPDRAGMEQWHQRIFYICDDGLARPLSALTQNRTIPILSWLFGVLGLLASQPMRPAWRLAFPLAKEAFL